MACSYPVIQRAAMQSRSLIWWLLVIVQLDVVHKDVRAEESQKIEVTYVVAEAVLTLRSDSVDNN